MVKADVLAVSNLADEETLRAFLMDIAEENAALRQRVDQLEKFRWVVVGAVLVLLTLVVPTFIQLVV